MNHRLILLSIMFVLMAALIVALNLILPNHGWVTFDGSKLTKMVTGWSILIHLWPVVLFGALISGTILFLMMGYSYRYAEEKDHEAELHMMQQKIDEARSTANRKVHLVKQSYEERELELDKKEAALKHLRTQSEALQRTLNQKLDRVEELKKDAQIEIQRVTRKKNNAMAAMSRRRKKQEKLNAQNIAQT